MNKDYTKKLIELVRELNGDFGRIELLPNATKQVIYMSKLKYLLGFVEALEEEVKETKQS